MYRISGEIGVFVLGEVGVSISGEIGGFVSNEVRVFVSSVGVFVLENFPNVYLSNFVRQNVVRVRK